MLNYVKYIAEYINIPSRILIAFAIVFGCMQLIGELLAFKGKVVPAFMTMRKNRLEKKRKEEELEALLVKATNALEETRGLLQDVKCHYSEDNIAKRDGWMQAVNEGIANNDHNYEELKAKLDETFSIALSTHIENQRNTILSFANRIADGNCAVSHEEFRRVIGVCEDYEATIEKYEQKNGQVVIAYRMISEEYENRLRTHAFIEHSRGYEY